MKIMCLSCGQYEFDVSISENDLAHTPVITLYCPACGTPMGIRSRSGGGIEVGLDKHVAPAGTKA